MSDEFNVIVFEGLDGDETVPTYKGRIMPRRAASKALALGGFETSDLLKAALVIGAIALALYLLNKNK